jgi:KUP system potassium uptake protein
MSAEALTQSTPHTTHNGHSSHVPHKGLFALSLGALGVVYGDIGTSPLYALDVMLFGHQGVALTPDNICGGLSLVIWALTIVVAIKYAILVLRADNDGEGGVFALYGLLDKFNKNGKSLLAWSLLLGAGLLFGDGIITPAISVLSSVEGLAVATPLFGHAVVPITVVILTVLFSFQYKGTGGVGSVFGPILVVWFVVIAALGMVQINDHPEILRAFNPLYGIEFLRHGDWHGGLLILGALMLVLTGGEAMYADMGHFGAKPIRISWFSIVYPCLILNYLGQGAFLLKGIPRVGDNLFYSMVPSDWLYPMVALATIATVIASQALISGAFSLTAQAIALGLFPRLRVKHTHHAQMGEVYVPFINWALYIGCAVLVITFGTSSALGAAYGLAVSGVMVTTSTAMFFIAKHYWNWSTLRSGAVFGSLALLDAAFLVANSLKFWEGGFVPLSVGIVVFLIMVTWRWGRTITYTAYSAQSTMTMHDLIKLHRDATTYIERTAILMAPASVDAHSKRTPTLLQMLWNRQGALPRNLIFIQVVHPRIPYVHDDRFSVSVIERNSKGSIVRVVLNFGFMEEPNVERVLKSLASHKELDLPADRRKWIVHVSIENLLPSNTMRWNRRFQLKLFKILRFISLPAYYHYGLGDEVQLSAQVLPIKVR